MVQTSEVAVRPAGPSGRIPPHNLEAEESLLGAMLISRDAITAAVEARVDASDFYKECSSILRCPNCARLAVLWNGFTQPPTFYEPVGQDGKK